jgi:hypothetical protein
MVDLCDNSPVTRLTVKVVPAASSIAIARLSKPDIMHRLEEAKYGE